MKENRRVYHVGITKLIPKKLAWWPMVGEFFRFTIIISKSPVLKVEKERAIRGGVAGPDSFFIRLR